MDGETSPNGSLSSPVIRRSMGCLPNGRTSKKTNQQALKYLKLVLEIKTDIWKFMKKQKLDELNE